MSDKKEKDLVHWQKRGERNAAKSVQMCKMGASTFYRRIRDSEKTNLLKEGD